MADDIGPQVNYLEAAEYDLAPDAPAAAPAASVDQPDALAAVVTPDRLTGLLQHIKSRSWVTPPQLRRPEEAYDQAEAGAAGLVSPGLLLCRAHLTRTQAWDKLSAPDMGVQLTVQGEELAIYPSFPNWRHRYTLYFSVPRVRLRPADTIAVSIRELDLSLSNGRLIGTREQEVARSTLTVGSTWPLHVAAADHELTCHLLPQAAVEATVGPSQDRAERLTAALVSESLDLRTLPTLPLEQDVVAALGIVDVAARVGWSDPRVVAQLDALSQALNDRATRLERAWTLQRPQLPPDGEPVLLAEEVYAWATPVCDPELVRQRSLASSGDGVDTDRPACAVVATIFNARATPVSERLELEFLSLSSDTMGWNDPHPRSARQILARPKSLAAGVYTRLLDFYPSGVEPDHEGASVVRMRLSGFAAGEPFLVPLGAPDPALLPLLR